MDDLNAHAAIGPPRGSVLLRAVCSPWTRLTLLGLVIALWGVVVLRDGLPDLASLQSWMGHFGVWAPLVFVAVYALATVSLFPASVLTAVAGLLFGVPIGVVVVWSGAMLGTAGSLALGGPLSRFGLRRLLGERAAWLGRFLDRHGTAAMMGVRLVPVLPLGLVNYAAIATSVRLGQYFLGTAFGILPATFLLVGLGSSATSPGSPLFLGSCAALGLLAMATVLVLRRNAARARKKTVPA